MPEYTLHITQLQITHTPNCSERKIKCLMKTMQEDGMRDIMKMEQDQEQKYFCMLKEEYGNPCLSPKKFIFFCRHMI